MKKIKYGLLFTLLLTFFIIPNKIFADTLEEGDIASYIECTKDDTLLSSSSKIDKDDILVCTFSFGLTEEANNKNFGYALNYEFSEAVITINNNLEVNHKPNNVDNSGNVTSFSTTSGNKAKIVENYKFKVSSDTGEANITINYKYAVKNESHDYVLGDDKSPLTLTSQVSYTIGETKSSDASLSEFKLSGLSISPYFSKDTYYYTAKTTSSSVTLLATKTDPNAKIIGSESNLGTQNLNLGSNTLKVVVEAENGTKKTYTLNITREEAPVTTTTKSNDSSLSSLTINGEKINLKSGEFNYSMTVSNSTTKANVNYSTNNSSANAQVSGDINLVEGDNQIIVTVTAEDGTTSTYKINITRKINVPKSGITFPTSIIFLGIVGILMYIKYKNRSYLSKI